MSVRMVLPVDFKDRLVATLVFASIAAMFALVVYMFFSLRASFDSSEAILRSVL
jgi:hypothetical protein